MWTEKHRTIYRQSGEGLPSDLTDEQWAHLEPLIPPADPGGRPRKTDMRAAMNAIFFLLRTGCPWRYLPRGIFPPRSTVYNIFRKFQREGVWDAIWAQLLFALREQAGREASPTAAIIDSQSLKSAEKGAVEKVKRTQWVTTPERRSRDASSTPWSTPKASHCA
jgi:transposase